MSKEDRQPAPTTAPPQNQGSDLVDTEWLVDYTKIAGKTTDLPQRKASQLIVDELKVMPDQGVGKTLHGGNMALSGAVTLGTVTVHRGPGDVSAAVRYAPRSSFAVTIQLFQNNKLVSPSNAENETIKSIRNDIANELGFRGDYATLENDLTKTYSGQFHNKTLKIVIKTGARGEALAAATTKYEASSDSKFGVRIDPRTSLVHHNGHDATHKSGKSHSTGSGTGTKATNEVQSESLSVVTTRIQDEFTKGLSKQVQLAFETVAERLDHTLDQTQTVTGTDTTWKVGIQPPKEQKPDDKNIPDNKGKGGGIAAKVKDATHWLLNKGKGALKEIPIVGSGIELAGDLWDFVNLRASIDRTTLTNDHTTKTTGNPRDDRSSVKISGIETVASTVGTKLAHEVSAQISERVAAKLGVEISTQTNDTDGNSNDDTYSDHVEVFEHEVGDLALEVERKG